MNELERLKQEKKVAESKRTSITYYCGSLCLGWQAIGKVNVKFEFKGSLHDLIFGKSIGGYAIKENVFLDGEIFDSRYIGVIVKEPKIVRLIENVHSVELQKIILKLLDMNGYDTSEMKYIDKRKPLFTKTASGITWRQ